MSLGTLKRYRLAALLCLGLILRVIALESRGLAYDDAFSLLLAEKDLGAIVRGTAADTMPPLYYFLLHFWIAIGGEGVAWLRLLSVLTNLAAIGMLYLLVRRLAGGAAGLWALLLAAISPLQVYHAQDLRMYALLELAVLGYAWFFLRIWQGKGAWQNWLGLIGCGAAAMYTHNLAIFGLIVPNVFLAFRREWRWLGKLIAAQAGLALVMLPWLLQLPGQLEKIQYAFWTPRPGVLEVVQVLILLVSHLPLPGVWLTFGLVLGLLVPTFMFWLGLRQFRGKPEPIFLLLLVVLPPLLLFATSYVMRPVFVTRGFLFAALAFLGLAGLLLADEWRKPAGAIILVGFIAGAAIGLPAHYSFADFPRSPFQAASQYLAGQLQLGDRLVHDNKLSFFPSLVYQRDLPQVFLADAPGSLNDTLALGSQQALGLYPAADIQAAVGDAGRVFFVVFDQAIQEYQANGLPDHPQLAWLRERYPTVSKVEFNDLQVYQFSR